MKAQRFLFLFPISRLIQMTFRDINESQHSFRLLDVNKESQKILPPARRFNMMRSVQEEGGLWIIELNQYLIFLNTFSSPLDVLSNHSTHDIQFQPISTGSLSKKSFPAAFQCRFKKNIFNRFRYGYCSQWDRHQKTMFRTGYILEKYHIQWCLNTCSCIMKEQGKNKDDFFLIYDLNIRFIMAHGCICLFLKHKFSISCSLQCHYSSTLSLRFNN